MFPERVQKLVDEVTAIVEEITADPPAYFLKHKISGRPRQAFSCPISQAVRARMGTRISFPSTALDVHFDSGGYSCRVQLPTQLLVWRQEFDWARHPMVNGVIDPCYL